MAEKYISFGPITNKDGSLTEFTKQFFGLDTSKEPIPEAQTNFLEIKIELLRSGLVFQASIPDRDEGFIIIAYHPISGNYSTHATEYDLKGVCWGHYDFPDFESARVDALERALHR